MSSVNPHSSMIHPLHHQCDQYNRLTPTLLPRRPPSPQSHKDDLPAPTNDLEELRSIEPPSAESSVKSQFDPRWENQFPSTVLYYTHDKAAYDAAEKYRVSSFYWQQAYMKTYSDLSRAIKELETKFEDLERRVVFTELSLIVCIISNLQKLRTSNTTKLHSRKARPEPTPARSPVTPIAMENPLSTPKSYK
ncbi:hypothetical protein F5Y06DRAFT_298815 [Hypoxylon sp. FL0890]|nr:hypothetical protein F5Y06DRAFT_298815 [Hypoxylon sp. FL0890]